MGNTDIRGDLRGGWWDGTELDVLFQSGGVFEDRRNVGCAAW
jgi:hypothetical protein